MGGLHVTELLRDQGRLAERLPRLVRQREHESNSMFDSASNDPARYWWAFMPFAYVENGQIGEAHAAFDSFARNRFQDAPRMVAWWFPSIAFLAEACGRLGRREDAQPLYELLLPHTGTHLVTYTWVSSEGAADHFLGMLAATLGRPDDAEAHFQRALRMHAQLESPPLIARTQLELAAMLAASALPGDQERARGLLDKALDTFVDLGIKSPAERASALQATLQASGAPSHPDGLTGREVEVLRLIAAGRSNAEIADALVLSVKTVERHTSNIYAKIGARGRAAATAYVFSNLN
jgi:DNA-binding CsgD family transcriptional regulator